MHLHNNHKLVTFFMVGVALIGLLDATYLSVSELKGTSLLCGEFGDCAGVTNSEYSQIFGVPVAYLGFLFYLTFFFLSLTIATFKIRFLVLPLFLLSIIGVGASAWFVFVQLILLKSICIYCMISALISTTLFVLACYLWKNSGSLLPHHPTYSTE